MPIKSIFEVEVDDSKFLKFKELFDRYQDQLKKLPEGWASVNSEIEDAAKHVEDIQTKSGEGEKEIAKSSAKAGKLAAFTKAIAGSWGQVVRHTHNFRDDIIASTKSLVKWSTLTTAIAGVLGVGSLWGIDRLASAVSASRRQSMGLGVTYGQRQSFVNNYGRLINSGGLLSSVSDAKYNVTSPGYTALVSSGISPQEIDAKNPAQLSNELLMRLPDMFKGIKDKGMIGVQARATGLDQLMPLNDIVAYLNASVEERKEIARRYTSDAKSLDLTDETQRRWQDLTAQLDRAAGQIEVLFMEKLAQLEPVIEKLSEQFVGVVKALTDSDTIDKWVKAASDGLTLAADYVASPKFQDDISQLVDFVSKAATSMWAFVSSFADTVGGAAAAPASAASGGGGGLTGVTRPRPGAAVSGVAAAAAPGFSAAARPSAGGGPSGAPFKTAAEEKEFIRQAAIARGLDPNDVLNLPLGEGGFNPNWVGGGDDNSSYGPFQLHYGGMSQRYPRAGAGDLFTAETGLDAKTNKTTQQQIEWSLNYIAKHGYGPWYVSPGLNNPHSYLNGRGPPPGAHPVPITPYEDDYKSAGRLPTVVVKPSTGANPFVSNFQTSHDTGPAQ